MTIVSISLVMGGTEVVLRTALAAAPSPGSVRPWLHGSSSFNHSAIFQQQAADLNGYEAASASVSASASAIDGDGDGDGDHDDHEPYIVFGYGSLIFRVRSIPLPTN